MSFIGDLGGVQGILLQICGWIIGGYAAFHSVFSTISALYHFKSSQDPNFMSSKQNNPDTPEVYKIKLALKTRVFLYLLTTPISFLFRCCKTESHDKFLEIINKGTEQKEEEFDLFNIIKESKDLQFEFEMLKEKMGCKESDVFKKTNPADVIDLGENQNEGGQQESQEVLI